MDWLIEGIVGWIAEIMIGLLNFLIDIFQHGIGLNGNSTLAYFFTLFSFCKVSYEVFLWAGFFILFTICVFQLFKSLFGPLTEAESPLGLVVRTIIFTVLIAFAKDICQFIINIGSVPYQILDSDALNNLAIDALKDSLVDPGSDGAVQGTITAGLVGIASYLAGPIILIIIIAYFVMLIKEFFKLLLEIVERYVILGLLTTVAPLCFACGASKATNHIFKSYIKMYISQIIVMCFSVFFLKAFTNALGTWFVLMGASATGYTVDFNGVTGIDIPNPMVSALMLLAWLKLGQKVDAHMGQLGLSVAQAGGMADSFMKGMSDQLNNADSTASKLANGISNKLRKTNFGADNKGNENAWRSLKNGNLGLKSAVAQQRNNDKSKNVAFGLNKHLAKGAAKIDPQKGAGAKAKAALARAGFKQKDLQAAMANKHANIGGSAETGGKQIGAAMKEAANLPSDWKATDNCSVSGGIAKGQFVDSEGKTHEVQMGLGNDGISPTVTTKKGEGEGTTYSIKKADAETMAHLTGADKNPGADTSANSEDIKAVNDAGPNMVKNQAEQPITDQPNLDNAVRFDEDGKVVDKPGEEPELMAKPDISDSKYDEIRQEAEAAAAKEDGATPESIKEAGDKAVENSDEFKADMQAYNESKEAHDQWQAQSDAYNNASIQTSDGQAYTADDIANAQRWDEDGNPMSKPDISDSKYDDIRQQAEEAAAKEDGATPESIKEAGDNAVENSDAFKADMQSYENAAVLAPDGKVYEAGSFDNAERFEVGTNNIVSKPDPNDKKYSGPLGAQKLAADEAKYNAASVFNKDGESFKQGAAQMPDGSVEGHKIEGNVVQGQNLIGSDGQSVNADNMVRFGTNADGKEIAMTKPQADDAKYQQIANQAKSEGKSDKEASAAASAAFKSDMAAYNNGSLSNKDGHSFVSDGKGGMSQVYAGNTSSAKATDDGFTHALRKEGTVTATVGSEGTMSAAKSSSNMVLKQDGGHGNEGRALLHNGGDGAHYQDQQKGNEVYSKSNGFMKASDANITNADGTHNTDIAGTYKNSAGQTISQKEAIGADGKLNSGVTFEPTKFTTDKRSDTASSIAAQHQSGEGVQLEMVNNNVARYDAGGNLSKDGDFVMTKGSDGQPGQLVSASAFETGANGNVATHSLTAASDSNSGYQDLAKDSSGQVQTFNYDASSNSYVPASDGKGAYVQDASTGETYAASSFARNDNGQIATMETSTTTSDTYDKLVSNGSGQPQTFNSAGVADSNGSYYKSVDSTGAETLVSKDSYETDSRGNTQTYTNTGSLYGNMVQTVDSNGKVTGYAELADPGSGLNPPKTYNEVKHSDGSVSYVDAGSNGQFVSTMVDGQQQYSRVRPETTDSNYTYPEPVKTYNAAPAQAEIASLSGTPAQTSVVGYSSMGSSVSSTDNADYYCKDISGNHHQIASYTDKGEIQRYSKNSDGSYYADSNGSYAQVVNPKDPAAATYAEVPSSEIYSANRATSSGINVSGTASNGNALTSINLSPSNFSKVETGVYSTNIDGQQFELYDAAMYDATPQMNDSNTSLISVKGRSYYAVKSNAGFDVSSNQSLSETYYGNNARGVSDRYSVPTSTMSSPVASKTDQGYCVYDSAKPRNYVKESTDKDGNIVPAHYTQDAFFVTKERPNGDPKSYTVSKDKKTGEDVYIMPTQLHYDSESGGTASLTFGKQIRDNNKSNRIIPRKKSSIMNTKIINWINPTKGKRDKNK